MLWQIEKSLFESKNCNLPLQFLNQLELFSVKRYSSDARSFCHLVILLSRYSVKMLLRQLAMLSNCHFVILQFCQAVIFAFFLFMNLPLCLCQLAFLSICCFANCNVVNLLFVKVQFCDVLSSCHFDFFVILLIYFLVIMSFCQIVNFINLLFCQLAILSTCYFVNLLFCQIAILSTCLF